MVSLKTASEHHHYDLFLKSTCVTVRYQLTAPNSWHTAKQRMLFLLDGRYFSLDIQGPELQRTNAFLHPWLFFFFSLVSNVDSSKSPPPDRVSHEGDEFEDKKRCSNSFRPHFSKALKHMLMSITAEQRTKAHAS